MSRVLLHIGPSPGHLAGSPGGAYLRRLAPIQADRVPLAPLLRLSQSRSTPRPQQALAPASGLAPGPGLALGAGREQRLSLVRGSAGFGSQGLGSADQFYCQHP